MTTSRLLSLAAGVCPETGPADFVAACATAGWQACGIWFDPDTWTDAVATEVRRRLDDTGLDRARHGARLRDPRRRPRRSHGRGRSDRRRAQPPRGVARRRRRSVRRAIRPNCATSRLPTASAARSSSWRSCRCRASASRSRSSTGSTGPNGGVLIDGLHLARTGGTPDDVASVAPYRLAYAQLCDAPAEAPDRTRTPTRSTVDRHSATVGSRSRSSSTRCPTTRRSRWRSGQRRCGPRSPTPPTGLGMSSTRRTPGSKRRTFSDGSSNESGAW